MTDTALNRYAAPLLIHATFGTRICIPEKVKWSSKKKGNLSALDYLKWVSTRVIAWEMRTDSDGVQRPRPVTAKGVCDQVYVLLQADNLFEMPFADEQQDVEEFVESMLARAEPKTGPKLERVGSGMDSLRTITLKRKS
jgi:hypothetical protein